MTDVLATTTSAQLEHDFANLYRAELTFLWNVLRKLGARQDDLEDLCHEVFVAAMGAWKNYDPARPVRPWLYGIAFRVLSHARRKKKESVLRDDEPHVEAADTTPSALEQLQDQQQGHTVLAVLHTLSLEHRTVLLMHDQDGIDGKTIARELELPVNTVYSRIRVARQEFRRLYRRKMFPTAPGDQNGEYI